MPKAIIWNEDAIMSRLSGTDKPDNCWEWKGSKNAQGYGTLGVMCRPWRAHRWAYTLLVGPIPDGMDVLHRCDNPACCNPNHLWLGTDRENTDDKLSKGRNRAVRGEQVGGARFTEPDIRHIRQLRSQGWTIPQLARHFTTSNAQVHRIIHRRTWKHV